MTRGRGEVAVSGEAMIAFGPDLHVLSWNEAAERLTGIPAEEALGQPCWLVLRGHTTRGAVLCHRDCSLARYAVKGFAIPRQDMTIQTKTGPRDVSLSTVVVRDRPEPLLVHLIQDGAQEVVSDFAQVDAAPRLTPRQRQVLRLLAEGVSARGIADRLGLAETTARNHIRAVLVELEAHSQLEAVARARAQGLV